MNKFLVAIAIAVATISANASYLYWQVDSSATDMTRVLGAWDTANVYAVKDGQDNTLLGSAVNLSEEDGVSFTEQQYADLTILGDAISSYSYYIELVNSSGNLVGYTQQTYAQLSGSIAAVDSLSEIATVNPTVWHGASSYNAPEPTSGLLMMLGAAMLGLRRKQRKME